MNARLWTALLLLTGAFAPAVSEAKPVAAVLYPGTARVTEEAVMAPKDGRITLLLPAHADADSLSVSLSSGEEAGRTLLPRSAKKPAAVAALEKEKQKALSLQDRLNAELACIGSMRTTLSESAGMMGAAEKAEETEDGGTAFGRPLEALIRKEVQLRDKLRRVQARADRIDADIRALGGQGSLRECVLDLRGTDSSPVTVRWTYWLNDAGWAPRYRVAADTGSGRVDIRMDAVITQKSGEDWKDVDVALSSAEALYNAVPPSLRDWTIGGERDAVARNVMLSAAPRAMKGAVPSLESSAVQNASSLTWKLGRIDVPASSTASRLVGEHSMAAEFHRLVRPSVSRQAWIQAELDEAAALALPSGQATFTVDGAETARGVFSLAPGARGLSFGIDQLVGIQMGALPSQAQNAGEGMKTLAWNWLLTLSSAHDVPVEIRVEEPAPLAKDARIRVDMVAEPAPLLEEGRTRYVWKMPLPAHADRSIRWSVTATAPEDVPAASTR